MVPEPRSAYALKFFVLAVVELAAAAMLSVILLKLFPADTAARPNRFSLAFGISTCMLLAGSGCMHRAVAAARRERQRPFRRWLKLALFAGMLFVSVQTYALVCLIQQHRPEDNSTDAAAFVAVFSILHGMHFVIALLFLTHVTIQALADRYDHEYFWGVTVCAWLWHALGLIWLAILFVMMIARFYI